MGGVGGILFFIGDHWIKFSAGLGKSSNNKVELLVLKLVLGITIEKGIRKVQIMQDSLLVIEWMKRIINMENINLRIIFEGVQNFSIVIPSVNFVHVYRERNKWENKLSKEGLQVGPTPWSGWENQGNTLTKLDLGPYPF